MVQLTDFTQTHEETDVRIKLPKGIPRGVHPTFN